MQSRNAGNIQDRPFRSYYPVKSYPDHDAEAELYMI
jgi:hypothetical protein